MCVGGGQWRINGIPEFSPKSIHKDKIALSLHFNCFKKVCSRKRSDNLVDLVIVFKQNCLA